MKNKRESFITATTIVVLLLVFFVATSNGQSRSTKAAAAREPAAQQTLVTNIKGITLGMTAAEARAKLGTPVIMESDQDYYIISDTERVQIAYNTAGKVVTVSVDYMGGVGAPEAQSVVAGDLELKPNGSLYKIVKNPAAGYWVSYNKSAGPVSVVTITLQKM
jgi:hypothetical protein